MLKTVCFLVLAVLLIAGVANAQTVEWRVDYLVRGSVTAPAYGDGSYMFLAYPEYVPVYLHNVNWIFIGMDADLTVDSYEQAYGVAVYPVGFPDISFPAGIDMIVVTPIVTAATVEPTPTTEPTTDTTTTTKTRPAKKKAARGR